MVSAQFMMNRRPKIGTTRRLHVALLVETSLASGRDILRGIARHVREHESWALYHEPRSLEDSVPRWLRHWKGDGIIARIQNRAIAKEVAATGIPVVDVLGVVPTRFPLVHVDDAAIARMGAEHLLERGLRRFGFFGISGENWSARRRDAFISRVEAAGCQGQVHELSRSAASSSSWETVEDDLAAWVRSLPKPAGVMVCSDQRGTQFLEACRRAGVSVPDSVAVISVDDDEPLCEVCNPPLTSVAANHFQVGYQAAALLSRLMAGKPAPANPVLVDPERVVTRLSTEVLAIEDEAVATALRLIREQACSGVQVEELARQAGLSRSVLQRRFRAALKRTVHQEILNVRLNRARDLLVDTRLSLVEVAERAGFNHQEYMGAVFRRRLRTTPARYRKEFGE